MLGFIGETIGKIFGTDKAACALVNNLSTGLDKLVYTNEEKSADHHAAVTEARQTLIDWLKASNGQNLSRRLIALIVTAMWTGAKTVSVSLPIIVIWSQKIDPVKAQKTLEIVRDSSSDITSAMMLVLGFYFAAPYMGDIAKGALERFGGKK